jgi:hypothetical protein
MTKKTNRDQVIRMQKLRHAVTRLRNFRDAVPTESPKQSWFARLKERLGMGVTK